MAYTGSTPLLEGQINALLDAPGVLAEVYDRVARELIETLRPEGYFEGMGESELGWPSSDRIGPEGLLGRTRLVDAIYRGVPGLRDRRLFEAHEQFRGLNAAYHEGSRMYLQLKEQFVSRGAGTAQDFLKRYQGLLLEALARGEAFLPDVGEAALARGRISRVPLSHAQAVASALSSVAPEDDAQWQEHYLFAGENTRQEGSLRELLRDVAQRTLDYIAAGELLATRFNTYNNLGWFGSSVWKTITDADRVLYSLGEKGEALERARADVRMGQALLIVFFQAHQEDAAKLKPENFWYGQHYSYLTRDLIDLIVRLVDQVNNLAQTAGLPEELEVPPLLAGTAKGRFLEYPHVGKTSDLTPLQRGLRFARWARACWRVGRTRRRISQANLTPPQRYQKAWDAWLEWSQATMNSFDIRLKVTVDPLFAPLAKELDLGSGKRRVLFLPAHQGMLEHFVVFSVFQSKEFLEAIGWEKPIPFVQLARTGLAHSTAVKIGPWEMSIFGVSPDTFDSMFEDVDGYITRESIETSAHIIPRILDAMEERPGLIYPMGTTAAFREQVFPLQHALFAKLPQDVVIVPVVFRGSHALWPRCPKGNMKINPGVVEAVILPPMPGETTLLPKRGSLRVQSEVAALFQAVHISHLLNPEVV